jgi:cellulose synthase operon protein C
LSDGLLFSGISRYHPTMAYLTPMRLMLVLVSLLLAAPVPTFAGPIGPLDVTKPEQAPPKLAAAVAALKQKDTNKARTLVREFLKEQPNSAYGYEVLGITELVSGQWKDAETALLGSLKLDPSRQSARLLLGQLYLQTNEPAKAEPQLREAIRLSPNTAAPRGLLAEVLLRLGRPREALTEARESLRLSNGPDVGAQFLIASSLNELGRSGEAELQLNEVLKAQPDYPEALLLQGLVKLELFKLDEAEALLKRVTDKDPTSQWGRLGLGVLRRLKAQNAQSRTELEKLVKDKPDWSLAQFELGRTLLSLGEVDAALKAFDRAEQTSSDANVAKVRVAGALLAAGDTERGLARARVAASSPTAGPLARQLLVSTYAAQGRPEAAEADLKAAAAKASDLSSALDLGNFYLRIGRPKEAVEVFTGITRIRPDAEERFVGLALAYAALGNKTEALAAANRVVKAQDNSVNSQAFLASIHERLGQRREAETIYRSLLAKNPANLEAGRALAALNARDKRYAEAIRLLEDLAKANPKSAAPVFDLGQIYLQSGKPGQAITAYREALARGGDDPVILNNLAYLLGKDAGTRAEALRYAERAHRMTPGSPSTADTLGWLLYLQGDVARSEKLVAFAAKTDAGNPEIHYHRGAVLAKLGKRAEARQELELALKSPGFSETAEAKRILESIR